MPPFWQGLWWKHKFVSVKKTTDVLNCRSSVEHIRLSRKCPIKFSLYKYFLLYLEIKSTVPTGHFEKSRWTKSRSVFLGFWSHFDFSKRMDLKSLRFRGTTMHRTIQHRGKLFLLLLRDGGLFFWHWKEKLSKSSSIKCYSWISVNKLGLVIIRSNLTFTVGSQVCNGAVTHVAATYVNVTTSGVIKARVWKTLGLNCKRNKTN